MSDEGDEDLANEPESSLESRIELAAADHFMRAQKAGVHQYFLWMRDAFTVPRYHNPEMVRRSIDNFLIDRYEFYSRHRELVTGSQALAYRDTFEYMISLLHNQPMMTPPMTDDWRGR